MTIQWRFDDAEPWHLRIANGSTAARSRASPATPTSRSSRAGATGSRSRSQGEDPRRLLLRRRIRPRGSLRNLLRLGKVFPPRPNRLG